RDDGQVRDPEWLLIEWPKGESGPTKFVLSTLPPKISCKRMVRIVKSRWRIERSYEDLKGELGLDHYEGRSFIGWHHHVSVVLACYAFLVAHHAAHRAGPRDPHSMAAALPVLPARLQARALFNS